MIHRAGRAIPCYCGGTVRPWSVVGIGAAAVLALGAATGSGCSGSSSPAAPVDQAADPVAPPAGASEVAVVAPAPLALGASALDAFGYRRGPGRGAYDDAVKAEKRGDWAAVIAASQRALQADPDHLDAAWLLAAALARQGTHDQILAPLSRAIAGDWAKWGERSLTLPLFDAFRASRWGQAWATLAEHYRVAFAAAAPTALIVLGRDGVAGASALGRRAEIYGYVPASRRWLRLSRTGGTVVAALPAPGTGLLAYIAYRDLARRDAPGGQGAALARPRVAVIDLGTGRVSREIALADVTDLRLWWKAGKAGDDPDLALRIAGGDDAGLWTVDWKRAHKKRPAKGQKLPTSNDAIAVARGAVRRHRMPVAGITADWDDDGLASAIRIERTRRTVSSPAGLLIDGNSLQWSADGARVLLVATPVADCAAPARVFVVDAGTGKLRPVGQGVAPAPIWLDATRAALTDGDRVRVVDVTSGRLDEELTSAGGVATAIIDRRCATPDDEALFAAPADDDLERDVEADLDGELDPAPGAADAAGTAVGATPGTASDQNHP